MERNREEIDEERGKEKDDEVPTEMEESKLGSV